MFFICKLMFLTSMPTAMQDAATDIDAKYVKRHGSMQECFFSGSQNQNLTFTPLFLPNRHFGSDVSGT